MTCARLRTFNRITFRPERRPEFVLHHRFSVYEPDWSQARRLLLHTAEPGGHLRAVSVRTVSVDDLHAGAERDILAEDPDLQPALHYSPAKRVLCLESHDENRVPGVACSLSQVVQDAPVLHHASRCDYDHRAARSAQCFR